ncbi:MAG: DNA-3-methyladenine glycosylase 2 family protein [Streptosporangiales bacterium]|nr:DNA-3-methyladenine glycosylase 2 family protein [Streptosporangiales bacterium]MBO0889497.1 DNA-3-methyladenine glycosylase 2 family protein [Acidothermales bacterium]
MPQREVDVEVVGPWSLETSRAFWEGFTPAALPAGATDALRAVFCVEGDWRRAAVEVTQHDGTATVVASGSGDLDTAVTQACRFLSLDVDARAWPDVARRDPVIADAQARLPGLRPCGFHSPYEAAAWAVLSQRIRIVQAARLRDDLVARHGDDGAFPAPQVLRGLDLDLPGRKAEYLHAVAEAALDGLLDGAHLRSLTPDDAVAAVREVKGLGPFAAELVVIRGANAPDAVPGHERRLDAELTERYGPGHTLAEVSPAWRPFRTWAAVHLRALREARTHEIGGRSAPDRGAVDIDAPRG